MDSGEQTPRATGMRRCAAEFADGVTARTRLPLDYGVASLGVVDRIIDGLRRGGARRQDVDGPLLGLGAYVGEVLVRQAGAEWVDLAPGHPLRPVFGHPVAVRMPDGRLWNPLGRTVNRFEIGPQESLRTYFLTLHGRWPVRPVRRDCPSDGRATSLC
ncbi:hypothetical protein [Streptomyces cinereoruber]|uniref:hypothetical protein n=1 Tax=Streptomyces cinereoruber TaxID=67260 RepID=UPI003C2AF0C1